ncbi:MULTISPECIES: hypothetical protein [Enterobacteriaceae]|uniref:hypothetical protein n=1 Tax=Enterobacteriaceae TaxID=543 RepID=UPI0020B3C167|nr:MULTISPECIES: hypothetical protein [Enterobacteriaceae]
MSKIVSFFKNKKAAVATAVVLATASVNAFAVEGAAGDVDLSSLTNNISFAGVITAVMAIAASIITLYAAMAGVKKVVHMVKSA